MTTTTPSPIGTITTTEISLAKLLPSRANVRRTGRQTGIDSLAASLQAHGLLQPLLVRPQQDGTGQATGRYEVVAGGRRLAALKLLAKQKRLAKGSLIPCRLLAADTVDELEASLAENVMRQDMHPADQFEAFHALQQGGTGIEDIAARFGTSPHTVRQRLRLAVVAPSLRQAYRDAVLTLDHLMAFTVTEDQAAQERVFGQLQDWQRHPETIRRLLTQGLVAATDRKVAFVGLEAYAAAGGTIQRDLFSEDDDGWIADPVLLEGLVAARMEEAAATIRAEGWGWVVIGDPAAAECYGLRRLRPDIIPLSEADTARREALGLRHDELAEAHADTDALPDTVAELAAIEQELAALENSTTVFQAEDKARGGASLTLAYDGTLRIERGFLRPEDVAAATHAAEGDAGAGEPGPGAAEDKTPALSAALTAELLAQRTAGLQAAILGQGALALRIMLHRLATEAFYGIGETIVGLHAIPPALASCPGIADSPARLAMAEAETAWRGRLPQEQDGLWSWLAAQDMPLLLDLLAVCVARAAHAGNHLWTTPEGGRCIAAQVAAAAGLDMRPAWTPTPESYLGRVSKPLILEAVREGAGAGIAARMTGMKKAAMAQNAETLLRGKGWLPVLLRVPLAVQDEVEEVLALAAE